MHSTQAYLTLRRLGFWGWSIIGGVSWGFWIFPDTGIHPGRYFLAASLLWAFSLWHAWTRVPLNKRSSSADALPDLGLANGLTLVRAWLIALTGGFLLQPIPTEHIAWLPGICYSLAAALDRVDGFIARRSRRTTLMGAELDTVFDALGLLVAPLLAVQYGKVHWSFLAVSAAYYIFIAGVHWRTRHGRPVYPLLPSQLRRAFAGFQMGFVALVLLPVFPAHTTRWMALAFMLPIVIGFWVDWLVVSGRIDGKDPRTLAAFAQVDSISKSFLLPALRALTAVFTAAFVFTTPSLATVHLTIVAAFAVLMLTGLGARIAALGLLLVGIYSITEPTNLHITWLCLVSWVLLLGPGRFCLWRGDDQWVNRQDGAP